jgi:uncharacterized membrane protein YfcA
MEYIIVCVIVIFGALLTFFSGFGLGTLLLPTFSIFFPVSFAIAATGIVHFSNNVFKFLLVFRNINFQVLLKFGIPALLAAILGSYFLISIGESSIIHSYSIGSVKAQVTSLKILIGALMLFFAIWEFIPQVEKLQFSPKYLPVGGILSGFFGGLSGHQGAFRSAFLVQSGLSKDEFIATSNAIALVIDVARLSVYATGLQFEILKDSTGIILAATIAAFFGTLLGNQILKKTSFKFLKNLVGLFLAIMGLLIIAGIL